MTTESLTFLEMIALIITFFRELPPQSGVKGHIETFSYKYGLEEARLEQAAELDYVFWKNKINEYVKVEGSSSSSNNIEWLNDDRSLKIVIYMISAMRSMNKLATGDIFKGGEPYRFFYSSSMTECALDFSNTITDEVTKTWTEKHGTKLWEEIERIVKMIMKEDAYEIYAYKPAPEVDPLSVLSSCYRFFYNPTSDFMLAMQFAYLPPPITKVNASIKRDRDPDEKKFEERKRNRVSDEDAAEEEEDANEEEEEEEEEDEKEDEDMRRIEKEEYERLMKLDADDSDDYAEYKEVVSSPDDADQHKRWKDDTGGSDDE